MKSNITHIFDKFLVIKSKVDWHFVHIKKACLNVELTSNQIKINFNRIKYKYTISIECMAIHIMLIHQ